METDSPNKFSEWLRDYSRNHDPDSAFEQIVSHLKPLIYQVAFRRSGDPELAKDVTQSVFLIIAKKAGFLSKHPAILGWVHETTRTETLHSIRAHARRAKREETAMKQLEQSPRTNRELLEDLDESMKCLSSQEKELILMKYFEGRTYQSITARTGRSESAEKMRLKRALEKLSKWFGRKGITLSITGLASALGTELAKGAPAFAIHATALAIPPGNTVVHTLTSMSPAKLSVATGLLVLAGAAAPLSSAWHDLKKAKEIKADLNRPISKSERARHGDEKTKQLDSVSGIIDKLTDVPKDRYGKRELGLKLIDATVYHDQALLHELDQILVQFETEELTELAKTIKALPEVQLPNSAIAHLLKFLPKNWTAEQHLNWTLAVGAHSGVVYSIFSPWLSEDPSASRKWLMQETCSGNLTMNGFLDDYESTLWKMAMKLNGVQEQESSADFFLGLPEENRQRLSSCRVEEIPRATLSGKSGIQTTLKIIRRIDDSSKHHWIRALVQSKHAPTTDSEFKEWLGQLEFNPVETRLAMQFHKKNSG